MFDLRYHITSLMAVFLALGLGILVGITIVDDEALVNEQKYLIDRLEEDFRFLREQNAFFRKQMADQQRDMVVLEEFSQTALPYVIKDRLKGKKISIVQTTGAALPEGLVANLEIAGAEIVSVVNIASFLEQELQFGRESQEPNNWAVPVAEIAGMVCAGLSGEDEYDSEKSEKGNTSFPGETVEAVILVGGGLSKDSGFLLEELDLPLISLFQQQGLTVAGVEISGIPYSYLPHYRKSADIVVERIDKVYGQAALIWALTGFPGYYGVSNEAISLLPPVNFDF